MKNKTLYISTLAILSILFSSCRTPLPPLSEKEVDLIKRMGGEVLPDRNIKIGKIIIHRREKELSFPAKINMTEGDLEVLICTPVGRTHESLLVSETDPFKLQLALYLLGAVNGARFSGGEIRQGNILNIDVQAKGERRKAIEKWLFNKETSKEMIREGWVFVGSSFTHDRQCLASEEGNLVNVWSFGNTILDNPAITGSDDMSFSVYTENVPALDTPVRVYMYKR